MVEIECPLCAETIDLGMAEEGEYECPYCEDVFHWKPEEFRDIENLQCPKAVSYTHLTLPTICSV